MDEGLPTPSLDDAPTCPSSLLWVVTDFNRLESERPIGMGVGAIPVTRMYEYLAWTGVGPDLWEECVTYWTALDRETLQAYAEKQAKSAPKAKASRGNKHYMPKD